MVQEHHPVGETESSPFAPVGQPRSEPTAGPNRGVIGVFGVILIGVSILALPVIDVAMMTGLQGDGFQRFQVGVRLLFAAGVLLAVLGFSGRAYATLRRSRLWWVCVVPFAAVIIWAAVGIDSTRPVRALPESDLTYPGAIETGRWTTPAEGWLDGVATAQVGRAFVTSDSYAEVQAFFGSTLAQAGWEGPVEWEFDPGVRDIDWRRDGFRFRLHFPSTPDASGPFKVTIYGPPL